MKVCVCDSVVTKYNELLLCCEHTAPNQPCFKHSLLLQAFDHLQNECYKVIKNSGREGLGVKLTQL